MSPRKRHPAAMYCTLPPSSNILSHSNGRYMGCAPILAQAPVLLLLQSHCTACNHKCSKMPDSPTLFSLFPPTYSLFPPTYFYIQMRDTRVVLQYSCKLPCSSFSNPIALHPHESAQMPSCCHEMSALLPPTYCYIQMRDACVELQCSCNLPCPFFSNPIALHAFMSTHNVILLPSIAICPPSSNILSHPDV